MPSLNNISTYPPKFFRISSKLILLMKKKENFLLNSTWMHIEMNTCVQMKTALGSVSSGWVSALMLAWRNWASSWRPSSRVELPRETAGESCAHVANFGALLKYPCPFNMFRFCSYCKHKFQYIYWDSMIDKHRVAHRNNSSCGLFLPVLHVCRLFA